MLTNANKTVFFCQTENLPATLKQGQDPAVQQALDPSRAEHHPQEHDAFSLQAHKFEGCQLWPHS